MKSYNPKDWFTVFSLYRQDSLNLLWPILLIIGIYTLAVDYYIINYTFLLDGAKLKNLSIIHSLLGLVISLLLVFRTNTAYDRWWEGRKIWGALVNTSRNLALRLDAILPKNSHDDREFFASSIGMYAKTLDRHLKSEALVFALDEDDHPELKNIKPKNHGPNQVASKIHSRVYALSRDGLITQDELITLSPDFGALTDICGKCERIKNTPIPYSYASFIKKFILFFVVTLPWSLANTLGYWSAIVVIFIMYAFGSLEVIAEEIEEPFGLDPNDLPTGKIALNISANVKEILIDKE